MKALTGSCSKATVESSLERRVGSFSVSDHQRHEFCLRPLLRNDKAFNSRLLQLGLVQRGFQPLHAIESKIQDLETVDPEAQDQQITNELKFVHVKFQLQKRCMFGEQFLIAGDDPMFGVWEPEYAIPMTWSDGHVWTAEMDIPTGKSIQFKFILKKKGGDIVWQPGPDRIFHTGENMNRVTVCEDWENFELQKILEEEQSAHLNKEPQINSEMSMLVENSGHPDEKQGTNVAKDLSIEDSQTQVEEKPLAEPDLEQIVGDGMPSKMEKPLQIVAENIGSLEDANQKTSVTKPTENTTLQNEESGDSLTKEAIRHDFGHHGKAAPIRNEEDGVVDDKLFELQENPVLVPGLTLSDAPSEEVASDEVKEKITMDSPIEAFEAEDQNMPEIDEEQNSDDGLRQEINAALNNKEVLHDNGIKDSRLATTEEISDFLATTEEISDPLATVEEISESLATREEISESLAKSKEMSDSDPVDGYVLKSDIQWGRETLKKFLTKLGLA